MKNLDGKKEDKGWKARESMMAPGQVDMVAHSSAREFNQETLTLFEEFISDLTNSGTRVFLVISPDYGKLVKSTSTIEYLMKMDGVTVLNFSNEPAFSAKAEYFSDANHLNVTGALKYTEKVCKAIKEQYGVSDIKLLSGE